MNDTQPAPLSEDELVALDNFLLSDACDEETLSVDEAHGFLTALLLPPARLEEAQWMEGVWGQPRFADEDEAERMRGLLRRLCDDIRRSLGQRRDFEPLVIETEEDGETLESYEGWCFGFMLGMEEQESQWQELPKNEQGLVAPMAQLALLVDEGEEMDEEEYSQWVELIPGAVMGLYAFWHRA